MSPEPSPSPDPQPSSEDMPELQDANEPEASSDEQPMEDEPQLLDPETRSLESEIEQSDELVEVADASPAPFIIDVAEKDDAGDADSITDEPEDVEEASAVTTIPNWDRETSVHRIAIELKRVEKEIRDLLEGRDGKRKRKLTGTRRWLDLEEDIISWQYSGRVDQETLAQIRRLITRRHYLFRRLHFVAGTRHGWNT